MADERQLVVSLALKANGYKSEITKINKETKLLQSEFDKAKNSSEDFEDSLEGQEKKLELLNGTLDNAKKKVSIYSREVERCESTLESATKAYEEQQANVADLERQLNSAKATYGATSQEVADLESKLELAKKTLEKTQKAVIGADNELLSLKTTLNKAESEVNQLSRQIDDTTNRIREFEDGIVDAGQSLQEMAEDLIDATGEAVAFGAHMSELGQGITDVGEKIGGAGNSILSSLNSANEKAIEFDNSINQLKASAGLTSEEFEKIDGIVDAVYTKNFGESYEEVADAVALIYKNLGYTDGELQKTVEKAFTLKDVFGYDVAESTRAADTLIKQFGLTGEESFNLITQGAQSNLDMSGELIDTINEYSVHFQQAGMSAEDMFNILKNGVDSGAYTIDKVADAFKEFNIIAKEGSEDTDVVLKELGFSGKEVAENMASGGEKARETFFGIIEALGEVEDEQKQTLYGVELFGTMFEDLGVDAVTSLADIQRGFDSTKNSAEELTNVKYDSVGSALETIGRTIETGIVGKIGESLMPLMEKLVPIIQNVVNAISGWIEANPEITSAIMIVAGVVGGLLAVLGPIIAIIGILVVSLGGLSSVFSAAGGIAAFFSSALLPIIGVIVGVIAVVVAIAMSIKENWDGIKEATLNMIEAVKPYFEQFKDSFSGLWETCKSIYDTVIQPLFKIIGEIIEECIYLVTPIIQGLLTVFSIVFDTISFVWFSIGQPIFSAIMKIIQKLWEIVKPIFRNISDLFSEIVSAINGVWNNILKPVFDAIISIVKKISDTVGPVFEDFVDDITWAMEAVLAPIQWVIDKLSDLFGWIGDASSKVGNFLDKINPFSKSIETDVIANVNQPTLDNSMLTRDVALSGSYYTPRTNLGSQVNQMASKINSFSSNQPEFNFNYDGIESMLDKKLSQMIQAMSNLTVTTPDIYLDIQKVSSTLDTVSGQNLKLYRRFNS